MSGHKVLGYISILLLLFAMPLYAGTIEDVELSLISPAAGDTFVAGQTVKVTYRAYIPKDLDLTWCEQEAYLSLDGGQTFTRRITGQLSPLATSFQWVVPNLPTDKAVINLRFGTDGGPGKSETSHIQSRNMFRIVSSALPTETVDLGAIAPRNAASGDTIRISWKNSVKDVSRYEVHASYNSGAHFTTIGTTSRKRLTWAVPSGFAGNVTFKVVAINRNGIRFESGVNARPDVVVK